MDLARDPRHPAIAHAMAARIGLTLCGTIIPLAWETRTGRQGQPTRVTCLWCAARRDYPRGRPRLPLGARQQRLARARGR